jgi:hypothetical protein
MRSAIPLIFGECIANLLKSFKLILNSFTLKKPISAPSSSTVKTDFFEPFERNHPGLSICGSSNSLWRQFPAEPFYKGCAAQFETKFGINRLERPNLH